MRTTMLWLSCATRVADHLIRALHAIERLMANSRPAPCPPSGSTNLKEFPREGSSHSSQPKAQCHYADLSDQATSFTRHTRCSPDNHALIASDLGGSRALARVPTLHNETGGTASGHDATALPGFPQCARNARQCNEPATAPRHRCRSGRTLVTRRRVLLQQQ